MFVTFRGFFLLLYLSLQRTPREGCPYILLLRLSIGRVGAIINRPRADVVIRPYKFAVIARGIANWRGNLAKTENRPLS